MMGCFDDHGCNTGLVLGLGFTNGTMQKPDTNSNNQIEQKPNIKPCLKFEEQQLVGMATSSSTVVVDHHPSLSLSLSAHHHHHHHHLVSKKITTFHEDSSADLFRQASSPHSCSAVSSFSSGRVKRERDLSSEEIDVERVSSRISDEDEDGTNTRKKLRLTKEQSALLEESFKQHSTLNPKQKQALARQLNLRPRQVEVWFQNRRARTKLKQTEVDCELLKKCCETLTDENRRLQRELQELKALKMAQPFYMHMPAATLTMCPSCERIGGVNVSVSDANPKNNPFSKPHHFYDHFTNPSAAC